MSRRDNTDSILLALPSDLISLRERVTEQAAERVPLREVHARSHRDIGTLRRPDRAAPVDRAVLEAKFTALEATPRREADDRRSYNLSEPSCSECPMARSPGGVGGSARRISRAPGGSGVGTYWNY